MFVVEHTDHIGPHGDDRRVIDHERDAWLQRVTEFGPYEVFLFKLVWGKKVISIMTNVPRAETDPATGEEYLLYDIREFGSGAYRNHFEQEIHVFDYDDDEEKLQAVELAAEALKTFRTWYGDSDGKLVRVKFEGRWV